MFLLIVKVKSSIKIVIFGLFFGFIEYLHLFTVNIGIYGDYFLKILGFCT